MPFVITVFLAPLCLCLAVYRLVTIPVRLRSGQLRFATRQSLVPAALACAGYVILLAYTAWLCVGVLNAAMHFDNVWEIVRLVLYFEAYPIVYVLAEWRFFYGLQPGNGQTECPQHRGFAAL